jgi:cytochrome c peroxidase
MKHSSSASGGARILFVHDDVEILSWTRLLENARFQVSAVRGCDAAIQEIENGLQPDLILQLNDVVRDKAAAIALGKAFFWEMQFGSDGFTACATCHFNAGADSRTMNHG